MTELSERMHATLLIRPGCVLCDQAHDLLERLASEYPLAVATLDADQPEGAALAAQTGVIFTPGIVIGGDAVASGRISERRLREAIERRLGGAPVSPTREKRTGARWMWRGRSLLGWLTRSW